MSGSWNFIRFPFLIFLKNFLNTKPGNLPGKYRITVNYYDYYSYPGKIPSIIQIRKFKNFGKDNQSIEVENVIMDNQGGEVEIAK